MSEETQNYHPEAPDGYVTSNARNTTVPMLGHMVTTRFAERVNSAYAVDFEATVQRAKDTGLSREFVPEPRFGADAFRVALKTLRTTVHEVTQPLSSSISWDNMRCKVWYDTVKMGKEYAVRRHATGLVNGVEHTVTENMYRISYRAGRGDVVARTYHRAYVKQAWEGHDSLTDAEKAALEGDNGKDNIEMEAYTDGLVVDQETYANFFNAVRERYEEEIRHVDTNRWRRRTRQIFESRFNAVPFTAVRGAVIIPDTRSAEEATGENGVRTPAPYLDELDALNSLMMWFGGSAQETSGTVHIEDETIPGLEPEGEEDEEKTVVEAIVSNVQDLYRSPCQMTVMGYIDDEAQRVELQRELTIHVNTQMNEYFEEFTETLDRLAADDSQEAYDKAVKRFTKRKQQMEQMLNTFCGGDYVDGVNLDPRVADNRVAGLDTRIQNIGSGGINVHGLRDLINFSGDTGEAEDEGKGFDGLGSLFG